MKTLLQQTHKTLIIRDYPTIINKSNMFVFLLKY